MKVKFLTPLLITLAFISISCSKKNSEQFAYDDCIEVAEEECIMEAPATTMTTTMTGRSSKKVAVSNSYVIPAVAMNDISTVPEEYIQNRKLIKNGNATVEVESLENMEAIIQNFAEKYQGYITDTYSNENSLSATLKIPAENFDSAMESTGSLGKVKYKSENSQDVTEEFYDLDSRINTKKILKEKLEKYLTQAKNMTELMEIERELNMVVSDLESMEGRMKRLSNQISYSTLYLYVQLPIGYDREGFVTPDANDKFLEIKEKCVKFFTGFLTVLVYIVIFGIPVLAVAALLYWLLFGRIGLLIKLFKFLSKKK